MKNVCPCIDNGDIRKRGRRLYEGENARNVIYRPHSVSIHAFSHQQQAKRYSKRKSCDAKCHSISNVCVLSLRFFRP